MDLTALRSLLSSAAPRPSGERMRDLATGGWQGLLDEIAALQTVIFSEETLWQVGVVVAAIAIAGLLSRWPVARLRKSAQARTPPDFVTSVLISISNIVWPFFTVLMLWAATAAFSANGLEHAGLRIAASLLNAWIVVRLVTTNLKPGFWTVSVSIVAWTVAALFILRWLDPVIGALEGVRFTVGAHEFNGWKIITGIVVAIIALWLGSILGSAAQSQLKTTKRLTPSMAGLLGQIAKVGFIAAAFMFALSAVGIQLTALAVFGGALGVGVGIGLQTIFSNFISGIIILMEKSIKVGDFIELQSGVTGEVREINIRSTLVTTNDNVDILIPNEEFIKAQVINWTLRELLRRIRIPFGVAYGARKEEVKKAALEAASAVQWTYDDGKRRAPQVWLTSFGDSSLDFELVVWLTEEAVSRPARVKADYYWEIHSALERYNIEIPFPQRDLNIKQPANIRVRIDRGDEDDITEAGTGSETGKTT